MQRPSNVSAAATLAPTSCSLQSVTDGDKPLAGLTCRSASERCKTGAYRHGTVALTATRQVGLAVFTRISVASYRTRRDELNQLT